MLRAEQAYRDLLELSAAGIELGLDRVQHALERLGRPQEGRPWIVVAGTNGKGSTCAFLASILQAAGYRVGLYTSPHLVDPRERIRVSGECISEDDFGRLASRVLSSTHSSTHSREDLRLTFFEALTCMAMVYFKERDVEIGILEVGLGGRLDAVNVVQPTLSVLGSIAMDHMDYLGSDIDSIATEKAGILRPRIPLAVNVSDSIFRDVIGPLCLEKRIPVMKVGREAIFEFELGLFSYRGARYRLQDITLGMSGRYQGENAALAVAGVEQLMSRGYRVTPEHVTQGLRHAFWPGRFQLFETSPPLVLDVAHNPAGMRALVESLRQRFGTQRYHVCFAAKRVKDVERMLEALHGVASSVTIADDGSGDLATLETIRKDTLRAFEKVKTTGDLASAIQEALAIQAEGTPVLITGSHRLVGLAFQERRRSVC